MKRTIRRLIDNIVIWFHYTFARKEIEALWEIVQTPIPPNDAPKNELQDCCYDMRDIACKVLKYNIH